MVDHRCPCSIRLGLSQHFGVEVADSCNWFVGCAAGGAHLRLEHFHFRRCQVLKKRPRYASSAFDFFSCDNTSQQITTLKEIPFCLFPSYLPCFVGIFIEVLNTKAIAKARFLPLYLLTAQKLIHQCVLILLDSSPFAGFDVAGFVVKRCSAEQVGGGKGGVGSREEEVEGSDDG